MRILGVRIDNFDKKEILRRMEDCLDKGKFCHMATVNPEIVLLAQKNKRFKETLNGCDLNIADGIGIRYAFLRHGKWLKCRFAGADLMHAALSMAQEKGINVFLAARKDGLSSWQETATVLKKNYPQVKFCGQDLDSRNAGHRLPLVAGSILLCNFGAPFQELFISGLKDARISLAIGVGGAFDFVSGKISRAPRLFRALGLEWLWRFGQEPRYRARRILGAVVLFPLKIIFAKKI